MKSLRAVLQWGWRRRRRLVVLIIIFLAAWGGKTLYDRLTASEAKWRRAMAAGRRELLTPPSYHPNLAIQHFEKALKEAKKFGGCNQRVIDSQIDLAHALLLDLIDARGPSNIAPSHNKSLYSLITLDKDDFHQRLAVYQKETRCRQVTHRIHALLTRAVGAQQQISGPNSPQLVAPLIRLAYFQQLMSTQSDENQLAVKAMANWDRRPISVDSITIEYFGYIGNYYNERGKPKFAETLLLHGLAMGKYSFGPHDVRLQYSLVSLRRHYNAQGEYAKAVYYYKRSWEHNGRRCRYNDPDYLLGLAGFFREWGHTKHLPDKTMAAERCYKRAIDHINHCVIGHRPSDLSTTLDVYASFLHDQGRYAEEKYYRRYAATRYPSGHP